MIVMKFGGSSLQSADRVREVAAIVKSHLERSPLLVLSAIGSTTNVLIESGQRALRGEEPLEIVEGFHRNLLSELRLPKELLDELFNELRSRLKWISLSGVLTAKTSDLLLSIGERLSVRLFASYLNSLGIKAAPFDGWEAGITTTSDFTCAEVLPETYAKAAEIFKERDFLPVVTGFVGKDREGNITTLGRGGSDLTASVLGKALRADEIQLWKDVDGILTVDPRWIPIAKPVKRISFAEAAELAYFGAKVLHPSSILPAMSEGIAVRVKNHRDPEHEGTLISNHPELKSSGVVAITHKSKQGLVHIASTRMLGQSGFLARVFQIFAELKISVDVIATSEVSVSLTLGQTNPLAQLKERLGQIATVNIEEEKSIISLIGNAERSSERLEKAIHSLNQERIDVQMISHGASKINTSVVVFDRDLERSLQALYACFFEEETL